MSSFYLFWSKQYQPVLMVLHCDIIQTLIMLTAELFLWGVTERDNNEKLIIAWYACENIFKVQIIYFKIRNKKQLTVSRSNFS